MTDAERRQQGIDKFNEVYCGDLPAPPEGASDFFENMLKQLFAEVWTRPQLSQRDRRLLTMGAIAALGEGDTYCIQVKAAVKNDELDAEQVRETLIHLVHYVGYPRIAGMLGKVEQTLTKLKDE